MKASSPTLIIGSGFSGSSVASKLDPGSYAIIDRGESIDLVQTRRKFEAMQNDNINRHFNLIRNSYKSKHTFNVPDTLSPQCRSEYILIGDGCSNHWGGLSFRLTPEVFNRHGTNHDWPFSYASIVPYYREAEQLLNIAYDARDPYRRNGTATIAGCDYWHMLMQPHFPDAYVGAQAHNLNLDATNDQGACGGAGDCELCPLDAKARPATIFANRNVQYDTLCREIVFENDRAIYAKCYSPKKGEFNYYFDRVVIAAHGVESAKLLWRSDLPKEVPHHNIGRFYQDHAVAEIYGVLRNPIKYWHLNTASQIVIPELSGELEGVEYITLGIIAPPYDLAYQAALHIDELATGRAKNSMERVAHVMGFYILLDIPPEWDIRLRYQDNNARLDFEEYSAHIEVYERIMKVIRRRMEQCGIQLLRDADLLHYRQSFGTHHLVGTLNSSKGKNGVVTSDFLIKGTTNCYVAGTALFPRCGGRNPTLTATALGLKLGELLARTSQRGN